MPTTTTRSSADLQRRSADDPGYHSAAYLAQIEDVELCRDLYEGTRRLREKGTDYLPQFPREKDESYERRKEQSVLFNAFRRTVKGLTGMVFRKDPVLGEGVDSDIEEHWDNIDLAGRHGTVFARDLFEAKTTDGHSFVLVDWRTAEGARSRAEETGARPYWVLIEKAQVVRWRTENRGGETVVTRFAYIERDTEPDGTFAERPLLRVRQYDLTDNNRVQYQSWVRVADRNQGKWQPEESYTLGERMTRIPVVCDYGDRQGTFRSRPPLLDLAFENVRHYQLRSDRDNLLHTSHVPILLFTGATKDQIENASIGPGVAVVLNAQEATGQYVEASGSALEQSSVELDAIEQRMAALGLAVIVAKDQVQRTATETAQDKLEQDSDLSAMARGTQDALEEALGLHAMWMGRDAADLTVSINRDFAAQIISPQMVDVVLRAVESNTLSVETLWDILEAGEVLGDWFEREMERERIEQEGAESLMAARAVLQAAGNGGGAEGAAG